MVGGPRTPFEILTAVETSALLLGSVKTNTGADVYPLPGSKRYRDEILPATTCARP